MAQPEPDDDGMDTPIRHWENDLESLDLDDEALEEASSHEAPFFPWEAYAVEDAARE